MSTVPALSYEEVVARIREVWGDVLGDDRPVPLDVNFLEFGGNSLLLVMLWEELQPLAGRRLKLSELFHHGSVEAQAELLMAGPDQAAPVAAAMHRGSRSLLAQRREAAGGGVA